MKKMPTEERRPQEGKRKKKKKRVPNFLSHLSLSPWDYRFHLLLLFFFIEAPLHPLFCGRFMTPVMTTSVPYNKVAVRPPQSDPPGTSSHTAIKAARLTGPIAAVRQFTARRLQNGHKTVKGQPSLHSRKGSTFAHSRSQKHPRGLRLQYRYPILARSNPTIPANSGAGYSDFNHILVICMRRYSAKTGTASSRNPL